MWEGKLKVLYYNCHMEGQSGVQLENAKSGTIPQEDPFLPEVKASLSKDPLLRQRLSDYVEKGVSGKSSTQVACIRSQDIITTLRQIIDGRVDIHYVENGLGIMGKIDGFYTTFNPAHSFFKSDSGKGLVPSDDRRSFNEVAFENSEHYGPTIAFATAVMRNIFPVLGLTQDDFFNFVRAELGDTNEWVHLPDYPKNLVVEDYLSRVRDEMEKYSSSEEKTLGKNRYPYASALLEKVPHNLREATLRFLRSTYEERRGVIVGYSDHLLSQGRLETALTDGLEASGTELVVVPNNQVIQLSKDTIVGIEPLGDYEEAVLKSLQLSN